MKSKIIELLKGSVVVVMFLSAVLGVIHLIDTIEFNKKDIQVVEGTVIDIRWNPAGQRVVVIEDAITKDRVGIKQLSTKNQNSDILYTVVGDSVVVEYYYALDKEIMGFNPVSFDIVH